MYLLSVKQMQEMDRQTIQELGVPGVVLMENAGAGCVRHIIDTYGNLADKTVVVVCGSGNNGGDGFVIARHLINRSIRVKIFLLSSPNKYKGDAAINYRILENMGVKFIELQNHNLKAFNMDLAHAGLVVDAILGTGLNSDVRGIYQTVIERINQSRCPIMAVDIPSGLHGDKGEPMGLAIKANSTVTFAFPKQGHFLYPGPDYTGTLQVIDISIPSQLAGSMGVKGQVLTEKRIRQIFKPRPQNSHKGTYGHLLVLAGSAGKTGAAVMAATSALKTGCGLVTVLTSERARELIGSTRMEIMTEILVKSEEEPVEEFHFQKLLELTRGKQAILIGPGMIKNPGMEKLLKRLVKEVDLPMVIDADGLNLLAEDPHCLKKSPAARIVTPHPGEMSRLTGKAVRYIQNHRLEISQNFAADYDVVTILKGAHSIIAEPDGQFSINTSGNPGMATAGMGDVHAGILGSLLAQGVQPGPAAWSATYIHGRAADLAAEKTGLASLMAADVIEQISTLFNQWGI